MERGAEREESCVFPVGASCVLVLVFMVSCVPGTRYVIKVCRLCSSFYLTEEGRGGRETM